MSIYLQTTEQTNMLHRPTVKQISSFHKFDKQELLAL